MAGQRAGHNMYYLDGVSVTDQYFNHLVASPPIDAIAEFNIQKSIYAAEFGGRRWRPSAPLSTRAATILTGPPTISCGMTPSTHGIFLIRTGNRPSVRTRGAQPSGPYQEKQTPLLCRLRRSARPAAPDSNILRPHGGGPERRFRWAAGGLRPSQYGCRGWTTAFPGNRLQPDRQDPVARAFLQKLPMPNLPARRRTTGLPRGSATTTIKGCFASTTISRPETRCSDARTLPTSTHSSPLEAACSTKAWFRALATS